MDASHTSDASALCGDEREEIGGKIAALIDDAGLSSREGQNAVVDAISDVAATFPGY
jgi:hypothetical protein